MVLHHHLIGLDLFRAKPLGDLEIKSRMPTVFSHGHDTAFGLLPDQFLLLGSATYLYFGLLHNSAIFFRWPLLPHVHGQWAMQGISHAYHWNTGPSYEE